MAAKRSEKVVVRMLSGQEACKAGKDQTAYRVEKLVNRVKPQVGSNLTEREVEGLIRSGRDQLTVEVLAAK